MRFPRSSALTLAVGYTGLGLAALALFAVPWWYAWRVTVQEGRYEILQSDAQRLTEVFRRTGAPGLVSYLNARVKLQIAGERVLSFADASGQPLAGNLNGWPAEVPVPPGYYTLKMSVNGGVAEDTALVHTLLPGGYHLLVGRSVARYVPLERRFWYALASAVAILSVLGALGGILIRRALMVRIDGIRQTVSALIQGAL